MFRFISWARVFIVLFCVDYNLADDRDKEIQGLIEQVKGWHERHDYVCPTVGLKEDTSRNETKISINIVEKVGEGRDASHYRFDVMKGAKRSSSFYDFQIDAFVYYFANSLRFVIREGGKKKTLSLNFPLDADKDLRYFYSKALNFGNVSRGMPVDETVCSSKPSLVTYQRHSNVRKGACSRVDIAVRVIDDTTIYNLSTYANDRATTADVPVLIFSTKQFNIGGQAMGRKVMLYLTEHPELVTVILFPAPDAATKFYNFIKGKRFNDNMIPLTEMQYYDRLLPE